MITKKFAESELKNILYKRLPFLILRWRINFLRKPCNLLGNTLQGRNNCTLSKFINTFETNTHNFSRCGSNHITMFFHKNRIKLN